VRVWERKKVFNFVPSSLREQKKEEKNLTAQNLIKYNVYYGKS